VATKEAEALIALEAVNAKEAEVAIPVKDPV
jgi:hypothetical protein